MRRDPALASRVSRLREPRTPRCATRSTRYSPSRFPSDCSPRPRRRRRRAVAARRWLMPVFAAAATLVLGLGVGWTVRGRADRGSRHADDVRPAGGVHARAVRGATCVGRSRSGRTRKRASSPGSPSGSATRCTPRTSTRSATRWSADGWWPATRSPPALFMYENADKQRLTLQVRKDTRHIGAKPGGSGDTAFRYAIENGVGVFYWVDDECGYALSGNARPHAAAGGRARRLRPARRARRRARVGRSEPASCRACGSRAVRTARARSLRGRKLVARCDYDVRGPRLAPCPFSPTSPLPSPLESPMLIRRPADIAPSEITPREILRAAARVHPVGGRAAAAARPRARAPLAARRRARRPR